MLSSPALDSPAAASVSTTSASGASTAESLSTPQSDLTSQKGTSRTAAAELERISAIFPEVLNSRDFAFSSKSAQELLTRLTPNFRARLDTYAADSEPVTLDEQISRWRARVEDHPDVLFNVQSISSHVDNETGRASVWCEMEVTGIGNVSLAAMNELLWRYEDNIWLCYYVIGMRGSSANSGFNAHLSGG